MQRNIDRFQQGQYDLLVIGGGINGAAIAHLAALNGLRAALLEKGDFASGTSSKSTKLIHGGLRYLENLEFGLVREAIKERFIQLKAAPHLVRPLSFIIPVYQSDQRPLWLMKLGVSIYDFLSGRYLIERRRFLTPGEVCRHVPGIKRDGLVGGIMYDDAQMDDARLCLENVLSADSHGAHVANYTEVYSFLKEDGKAVGVRARDKIGERDFEVRAANMICAVGPWTNAVIEKDEGAITSLVRTTKGVHVVCRGKVSDCALLFPTQQDSRFLFVIPWMGNSLIGTTDTDYDGDPDIVGAGREDADYLFEELRRIFPDGRLGEDRVITMFAGLRPLIHKEGAADKVSRRHAFKTSSSGITYVMGGKYTTYRKIAGDCLRKVFPSRTWDDIERNFTLYGSGTIKEKASDEALRCGVSTVAVQHLMDFYGTRYKDVLDLVVRERGLAEPICSCSGVIRAQILYAIQTEMARTEEDIYKRRIPLVFVECETVHCREEIRRVISKTKIT